MSRALQLTNALTEILEGEPWYSNSVLATLHGITAVAAATRPLAGAHTIWEITAHLDAWNDVCLRRLAGEEVPEPAINFEAPESITPEAWREVQSRFSASSRRLIARTAIMSDAALEATVPGKDYDAGFLIVGVGQHWVYHSGQIAMLRRAVQPG